jgi:hypothetical protein
MKSIDKQLLRLALAVESQLQNPTQTERRIELPARSWDSCLKLVRQARRAHVRGWTLAENELLIELRHALDDLRGELGSIHGLLPSIIRPGRSVKAADVYSELEALGEEFEHLDFNLSERWISVTTEPISLESVNLGAFEIRLDLNRLTYTDSAYRVLAVDPHPAESRSNVTHPHVMDDLLCEGDGRHAIRAALSQGRLLDFFLLVRGVLRTYNPESPFVELALWRGQVCTECGSTTCEEDCYSCERCTELICIDCEFSCSECHSSTCSGCTSTCVSCDATFCSPCISRCRDCGQPTCTACLTNERCKSCYENSVEHEESLAETSSTI